MLCQRLMDGTAPRASVRWSHGGRNAFERTQRDFTAVVELMVPESAETIIARAQQARVPRDQTLARGT